jgi:hypothetical protein
MERSPRFGDRYRTLQVGAELRISAGGYPPIPVDMSGPSRPNCQIWAADMSNDADYLAARNGGDARVRVLGLWAHSVSTWGRGVSACRPVARCGSTAARRLPRVMSFAVRNVLSGAGVLSLGPLCAILTAGRPSGAAPG